MNEFKILSIIPISAGIPLTETEPKQKWLEEWSKQLFVKVSIDSEYGWGEVLPAAFNSPALYADIVKRLEPSLNGMEISEPGIIWEKLRKLTFSGGYGPVIGAISGVDIALWDLKAKLSKLYLGDIFGKNEQKIARYASLSRYANYEAVIRASKNIVESGFKAIKLHQTKDDTLESVKRFREEIGYGVDLMVDLNCAMNIDEAIKFANSVQRYELKWVEEPIWPPDDLASLKKINDIVPVAAGENFFDFFKFEDAVHLEALTYYQPDVTKVGGLTPTLKILDLLKKNHEQVAFHNRPHNGWIGIFASIAAARMNGVDALIETPPNGVPSQYFRYNAMITSEVIAPNGVGLSIEPIEPLPQPKDEKILIFHD
ncbi:mandelate racemase/muconate lactonizing enzyme family protein [Thermoplasma acidophilum]|uniref:mandelate racemase/muconate lactonizing enzyme family protein n=1 Tax=Thermoplasma acidophilum TaxID=2303 RepID=UPI0006925C9B|nr:mandelate racemase/muconate lactonizing enzyme family protein [Thermoplasma acidophilum]